MSPDPIHNSLLLADKPTRKHCLFNMHPRFTILTLLLALLGISCQRQSAEAPVRPAVAPKVAAPAPAPGRPVFPYSVVSGGLSDATEMAEAVKQDPVVREHYAGLRPTSFRTETLQEDRQGYVSYRIRDKVYWTRRLMTLKKGETVLTDGDTVLRGRCGNRISPVAMDPALPPELEPTEAVLNSWQDSRVLAGIPPVPVASPVGAALKLDRSAPVDFASSLLIPPDSSFFGTFPPQAGAVPPSGIWVGGGSPPGGGSGSAVGGGAPPEVPPASVSVPGTVIAPPVPGAPPILIATAPPASGLPLAPLETPYFLPTPDPGWTPMVTYPLTALPPGVTPPTVTPPGGQPPSTNPPGVIPPFLPPNNLPPATIPPGETPPGVGGPPTSTPPTVADPPPSFPPPAPPEDETAVPEPATVLLAATALALLGAGRYLVRRRR